MKTHRPTTTSALYAVAAIALFTSIGSAQAQTKDVKISGMGIRKCSEWQTWKTDQNGEARATTLEWAQGFISGHNIYARSSNANESLNSVVADAKILVPLLDSFCEKNPDSRILNGVMGIIQSLGGAKINLTPKAPAGQNPRPDNKKERES